MKSSAQKIGDLCNLVGGSQPEKSTFISEPKEGYVRLIQMRDYKTDNYKTYIKASATKKYCSEKDVMIGRYGPPVFQILRGLSGAYNVALMKADPKPNVSQEFLYYVLTQSKLFEYIEHLSKRTGGQTGIDVDALKNYPVLVPVNETEQFELIETLYLTDQKIALNNQINAELEAMAKLIYDYWFVQFDFPDENGKPYKSSGGKMVWCNKLKRDIPEGWETRELCQIANITMGQSPAGTSYNPDGKGTLFYQGSTDFGWLFPTARQYTTEPSRLAKKGDILLSVRAPVGDMNIANADCCIGRGLAALHSSQSFDGYLFYVMKYFKQVFDRRNSQGTTFGSITKDDLHSLKVAYPSEPVLKRFEDLVSPMNKMIFTRSSENQELANLRDWLLPMLMNGQVTVGD